jgi:hypothetical protein
MIEDITVSLRNVASALNHNAVLVRGDLLVDAADEIERLRSEAGVEVGAPSESFVPVLLAPWVVGALTDPHASMHQERVESIWLSIVESCERAVRLTEVNDA